MGDPITQADPVPSGSSFLLMLDVTIPDDEPVGVFDETIVTATATDDSSQTAQATTATILAKLSSAFLPIIFSVAP